MKIASIAKRHQKGKRAKPDQQCEGGLRGLVGCRPLGCQLAPLPIGQLLQVSHHGLDIGPHLGDVLNDQPQSCLSVVSEVGWEKPLYGLLYLFNVRRCLVEQGHAVGLVQRDQRFAGLTQVVVYGGHGRTVGIDERNGVIRECCYQELRGADEELSSGIAQGRGYGDSLVHCGLPVLVVLGTPHRHCHRGAQEHQQH